MEHAPGFLKVVNEARPRVVEVTLDQARARLAANPRAVLLDVREDAEWQNGHAVVLGVDEKPHIQALERAQGWLRLPDGRALTGFAHEYTRHGTSTLLAALTVATGQVQAGHYQRRRRVEFLDFMN